MSFDTGIHGKVEKVEVRQFKEPVFVALKLICEGGDVTFFLRDIDEIRSVADRIIAQCDIMDTPITEDQREREPKTIRFEGVGPS